MFRKKKLQDIKEVTEEDCTELTQENNNSQQEIIDDNIQQEDEKEKEIIKEGQQKGQKYQYEKEQSEIKQTEQKFVQPKLIFKSFQQEMQKKLQKFDEKAFSQYKYFGFCKIGRTPIKDYDLYLKTKYRLDSNFILAFNDVYDIVGKIGVCTKLIIYRGQSIKAAYLFDFYLTEPYHDQGNDLFSAAIKHAQQVFNAEMVFFGMRGKLSEDLQKNFIDKLGFIQTSERVIACNLITLDRTGIGSFVDLKDGTRLFFEEISDNNEIENLIKEHYNNTDLFLVDFKKEILQNDEYKGCFLVKSFQDKENYQQSVAGINLYVDNREASGLLQRYFLPIWFFNQRLFMGIFDLLLVILALYLLQLFTSKFEFGFWISMIVAMMIYGGIQRFIQSQFRWVQQQKRPTLRIFAPFYKGDEAIRKDMFNHLFNNLRNFMDFKLFFDFRINLDKNCAFLKFFEDDDSQFHVSPIAGSFFAKSLSQKVQVDIFDPNCFFDPRDLAN